MKPPPLWKWRRGVAAAGIAASLCASTNGLAAGGGRPVLRDPAVPDALRQSQPAPITQGDALRERVQAKLRAAFDAADSAGAGHLSRAQAEAAGLGFVAHHFSAIDTGGHGSVSWAQVQAYLVERQRRR